MRVYNMNRNKKGKHAIITVEPSEPERSPIVTKTNQPKNLPPKIVPESQKTPADLALPKKSDMKNQLISKEELIEAMKKAGGKNLSTHQFAELITPCIKKSEDPLGHHKWDIAHGHVRSLAKELEKEGLIKIKPDLSTKKVRYLYDVV